MLYNKLIEAQFFLTLARVFNDEGHAKSLLWAAKIPREIMPPFNTIPINYWRDVGDRLALGAIEDGLQKLVQAAAEEYKGNSVFKQCAALLNVSQRMGVRRELRILFVSANPIDTANLRLSAEYRTISQLAEKCQGVRITPVLAVRTIDLLAAIRQHTPHALHFAGHGDKGGVIVLEDSSGLSESVSAKALARMLRAVNKDNSEPVECVVMTACWSAEAKSELVSAVDVSVGSAVELFDETALAFSRGFYTGVLSAANTQAAFEMGQSQVEVENLEGADQLKISTREGFDVRKQVLCPYSGN